MAFALTVVLTAFAACGSASADADLATGPIESGAGPGWPRTLSPNDFVAQVDNPWFPLQPGSEYRYTGLKDRTKMVDVVRVTAKTKRILGVETTVVHDVVKVDGRPEEETHDYYAQDRHGNVWYFGEATKTFNSHGEVVSTEGSFEAGIDGERAGVLIPGHPRVGQVGRQEFSPGEAEDHFKVLDLSTSVSVPFVSSQQALRTSEWTPLEPAVVDNKYYVRGIGTVSEVAVKGPVEQLKLVAYKKGKYPMRPSAHARSERRAKLPPYRERQEHQQRGENDEIDHSLAIGGGVGESELRSVRRSGMPDERGIAGRPGS